MKFSIIFFENWRFWKMLFFWVCHFECVFLLFPMKTSQRLLVSKDGSKFWTSQTWRHFLTQTKHFEGECNRPRPFYFTVQNWFFILFRKSWHKISVLSSVCCTRDNFWGNMTNQVFRSNWYSMYFQGFFTFDDLLFIFTNLPT